MVRFLFIIAVLSMLSGCVSLGPVSLFTPKHTLTFSPSGSPDVKEYILYVEKAPKDVTIESQWFTLGKDTSVDLWDLDLEEGLYTVGVTVVDRTGAEGSLTECADSIKIKTKKGD